MTSISLPMVETKWFAFHPHSYGIATLMRLAINLPSGRRLMLHHFRPHEESEFHDHPWSFRTRVLWGSYTDQSIYMPTADDLDHIVEMWHTGQIGEGLELHEVIGWEWSEYAEWTMTGKISPIIVTDVLRRGQIRFRRALHAHRTSCEGYVWTLVLTGPKERTWCKGDPDNWYCGGKPSDFDATRGMVKT